MCGLAGLFLPRGAARLEADLDAMISVMRHRGPDGADCHLSPDRGYQAAFARLAIIDLETGDQPITEGDGARVLMGNGEIYNYLELRHEMAAARYPYRTTGDMEVVLPLAKKHGAGFVHHLNGMYALALFERETHRLTLVRDRLGIKPLYWARLTGGGVLFGSEIKSLFASGLLTPQVNETAVSSYLGHGYVPAPYTLFTGVRKLAPGHRLTVAADGRITNEAYWQPGPAADPPADPQERRAHLIALMRDAVRLQLRADVPIGALLSGGIDSGLVVALAAGATERPLCTYTVRFEGAAVDETGLAALVARRYSTRHEVFDLAAGEITAHLPRLAWHADEPLADASLLPNFLIERALSSSVKVALNGTGGDELFAGYRRYFRLPVETAYLALPGWLRRRLVERVSGTVAPYTAWRLARAEKFSASPGDYLFDHSTLFPAPVRDLMGNRQRQPRAAQAAAYDAHRTAMADDQSGLLAADMETYLACDLLTLLDRTSMAVGVEGRVPLLDHRLVEAALAVPAVQRTPHGAQKGLLRHMAAELLPRDVVNAPKQGFASPVGAWLQTGLGPPARRILTRGQTLERGWWSAAGIDALLERPDRHGARIYALLMLELTIRIHVEDKAAATAPSDGLEAYADAA